MSGTNGHLNTMSDIMKEKQNDIAKSEQVPLDEEGKELAKRKRWTLDIPEIKSDPLR